MRTAMREAIWIWLVLLGCEGCRGKLPVSESTGSEDAEAAAVVAPDPNAPVCEPADRKVFNGKLTRCILGKSFTTGPYTCVAGKTFEQRPDGSFKGCTLATAASVGGFTCKDTLDLYVTGALRRCRLDADKVVGALTVKAGDWVTLFPSGSLKRLEIVAAPRELAKGLSCKGSFNYFYEGGGLKKCENAEATIFQGTKLKSGDFVCFDAKGKVDDCKKLSWDTLD